MMFLALWFVAVFFGNQQLYHPIESINNIKSLGIYHDANLRSKTGENNSANE